MILCRDLAIGSGKLLQMSIFLLQISLSSTIMESDYFPVKVMVDGFWRTNVTQLISEETEGVSPQDEVPGLLHMMV